MRRMPEPSKRKCDSEGQEWTANRTRRSSVRPMAQCLIRCLVISEHRGARMVGDPDGQSGVAEFTA